MTTWEVLRAQLRHDETTRKRQPVESGSMREFIVQAEMDMLCPHCMRRAAVVGAVITRTKK